MQQTGTGMGHGIARLPRPAQWALLVAGAALLSLGFHEAGLPGSALMGPMLAGILVSVSGATLRLPRPLYLGAQGMVGALIATIVTPGILHSFLDDWPLILLAVLATLAASSVLGWLMSFWRVLPGTTAIWGSAPGGASAMVVMAEAFGADVRMVALMQYTRVACVVASAAVIAHWLAVAPPPPAPWFPVIEPMPFANALVLALGGAWLGKVLRVPAGPILLPLIVGSALHSMGLLELQLPQWFTAIGFGAIGCQIGLGFTRPALAQAARVLPKILLSVVVLIALCGAMSLGLARILGLDPLTAYLAMSPGGIDSVAVIGAASGADMSFVMALQTMRMLVVVLVGPPLSRALARGLDRRADTPSP
ncbi:AbrB family transcriptional regulator [Pararoseomonas sp. SCSIO 73927]|uniref:AbrB family transcriptional regulator n=1 Tax=Pararoseomonas sp. SCSIO 73927 TaxID=3114537 RepID=UPI0030CFA8AC